MILTRGSKKKTTSKPKELYACVGLGFAPLFSLVFEGQDSAATSSESKLGQRSLVKLSDL